MKTIKYWTGNKLTRLNTKNNDVFVFGSNPQGRHHAGAALAAKTHFDAQVGVGRGLQGSFQRSYGLITKSLQKGYRDSSGILYEKEGELSVSPEMIKENIKELYDCAKQYPEKNFLISYQYDTWSNGSPKKSLNGYNSQEMLEMFVLDDIPENIVFHESYKPHLEKLLKLERIPTVTPELPKEIAFTKVKLPYGWLGNMAPYPVTYNGVKYLTTEALFQALRFPHHPDIQEEIIAQTSPMSAKMVAKKYHDVLASDGYEMLGEQDVENMRLCIKLKLEQHPHLQQELIDTQDVPLIEDCSSRPQGSGLFWGAARKDHGWEGKNILGVVWMEYRHKLQHNLPLEAEVKPSFDNLMVVSPRDKVPEGFTVINTTSKSDSDIGKKFSPFFLSGIELYEGHVAKNMENAWQFSKVYKEFADEEDNPLREYFLWAKKGWNDSFAHRYANGKGNIPLYSYWKTLNKDTHQWEEHRWDYITARKNIYFPLYAKAIYQSDAFKELKQRVDSGEKIALWDFDGYDHALRNMSYEDVVNEPKYKCGHAFVLYGLLTGQLKIINDELVYDFNNTIKMEQTMPEQKIEYTYFFHLTSPFSNFHPSRFEYKELHFISNEQFMMYSKAKTFKDEAIAHRIMHIYNEFMLEPGVFRNEKDKLCYQLASQFQKGNVTREQILSSPETIEAWNTIHIKIKKLGREVANYDDAIWNEKRTKVVLFGAREKFKQNDDLKELLMNTGNTVMVEASRFDKIWGAGLSEADCKKIPPEQWPGENLLGQILTYLKTEFANNLTKKMKP